MRPSRACIIRSLVRRKGEEGVQKSTPPEKLTTHFMPHFPFFFSGENGSWLLQNKGSSSTKVDTYKAYIITFYSRKIWQLRPDEKQSGTKPNAGKEAPRICIASETVFCYSRCEIIYKPHMDGHWAQECAVSYCP